MSVAPHSTASIRTGSRLATRLAAVAVVLALAGLAVFTIFSGPTTITRQAPTSKPVPTRTITVPRHTDPEGNQGD